ncbi:MAG: SIS domain-containing protein [Cyclobacteriaceae bacterium]|nr:SIS domain-containing protein [Cyclobacteriaceae bacterium]
MDKLTLYNYLRNDLKDSDITSLEISSQPELWWQTWLYVQNQQDSLKKFLKNVYSKNNINVILTGAGTSAFIGDTLQGSYQQNTGIPTRAISTTDLVTHPDLFLQKERPTLLISFARSGDSPESVAAVHLANKVCSHIYHLIITCNPKGKLASEKNESNKLVFLLPEETNDKGLAMTSSFTSMLLSGVLISRINEPDALKIQVLRLISYGENILLNYTEKLLEVAKMNFKRVVFLGSGPLKGTATESHLKLQELSDGKIICKHDSFLGFRHGPKAVIDKTTVIVYLLSHNAHVEQYENDLMNEVHEQDLAMYSIGILDKPRENECLDLSIKMSSGQETLDEDFLSICSILPAQILAYYKSVELGLNPDNPSASGAISRVVKGVKIYSYQ